ncbi:MAG: hypothetical protein NWQ37_17440, partial [Marivita lacus]|nr:hypothetical protein [Marivita lacus]
MMRPYGVAEFAAEGWSEQVNPQHRDGSSARSSEVWSPCKSAEHLKLRQLKLFSTQKNNLKAWRRTKNAMVLKYCSNPHYGD